MTSEPRDQVDHVRAKLIEELETLRLLEHKLRDDTDQNNHERMRGVTVTVALDHLQQAIDALDRARRE